MAKKTRRQTATVEQRPCNWQTRRLHAGPSEQIAAEIGITVATVKILRANVTRKMGAKSLADLVRMADALKVRRITS